mmetsp:Transcript_42850/g.83985  ORF Transcript_42850/g.83985 Transcript_42850/m.83985 type:complete len:119 (+) Transcript_42850:1342-1698(+)
MEPFWPLGTGVNRGFQSAMDTSWMLKHASALGFVPAVIQERQRCFEAMKKALPGTLQSVDGGRTRARARALSLSGAVCRSVVGQRFKKRASTCLLDNTAQEENNSVYPWERYAPSIFP